MIAAVTASLILLGLAVLQAFLAAGRPWGRLAWGGRSEVLDARLRIASIVSIPVYAFFVLVILDRAGATDVFPGEGFDRVAIWVLAAYFLLGTVMNAISRSKPERWVMTPVAFALCVCCVIVALS